jgi:SSS family solute:Na+ symporter
VGWWPGLVAHVPPGHLDFLTTAGKYNWKTVLAFVLLGVQWATLDQGLLQSAFSAKDHRVVSKGMVLSGIMITPFALLWITPGLAARILYPTLAKPEMAVPTLIVSLIPLGVLGLVTVGFLASGLSTIGSNLSAVATLISNDIYGRFVNKKATSKQLLRAVRLATVFAGLLMIGITYLVPYLGGAVDAYLTIISIMDMPLFVIAIPFGLLWKKTTWQGAMAGYLAGSTTGAVLRFGFNVDVAPVTLISGVVAAFVCPAVSLLTQRSGGGGGLRLKELFAAAKASEETVVAVSPVGKKIGAWVLGAGFAVFLAGVLMVGRSMSSGSAVAVAGMVVYFLGGAIRARSL